MGLRSLQNKIDTERMKESITDNDNGTGSLAKQALELCPSNNRHRISASLYTRLPPEIV